MLGQVYLGPNHAYASLCLSVFTHVGNKYWVHGQLILSNFKKKVCAVGKNGLVDSGIIFPSHLESKGLMAEPF